MPPTDDIVSAKPNKPKAPATEPSRATAPIPATEPAGATGPTPDTESPRALWPSPASEPLATTEEQPAAELISLTIDTTNARIVTIKRVDAAGVQRALTKDEKARLLKAHAGERLEQLIEQAF